MTPLPTLRQLRYLVALAEHRHFGRAAEACLVTQSTMSAGLQELETLLGCTLVERDRRHVALTPIGLAVVARARRLLIEAQDLVDAVRAADQPLSGPLRMGVIPTIAPYILPIVLPELRRAYPDLRLILREDLSARLAEQLKGGQLDVLLLALPWPIDGTETLDLGADPFLLAVPAGHPLAEKNLVDWDDIPMHDMLLLEEGHCLRDQALAACRMAGHSGVARGVSGTSLPTIIQMVAGGLGVTLLPAMAVRTGALAGTDLVARPLADPSAKRSIGLVWRASSPRTPEMRELAAPFSQCLARAEGESAPH